MDTPACAPVGTRFASRSLPVAPEPVRSVQRRIGERHAAQTDAGHTVADVSPNVAHGVFDLMRRRGLSPDRLCSRLGFDANDLGMPGFMLSYPQVRTLWQLARLSLDDPAAGLAAGAAQTPLSFGLPGLGMLTCRTLREALVFCGEHRADAGALLTQRWHVEAGMLVLEVTPRFIDPELEPCLVEEAFARLRSVFRILVGPHFEPAGVEFAYSPPDYAARYAALFNCRIDFERATHRFICHASWLDCEIATYARYASDAMRADLAAMLSPRGKAMI